MGRFQVAADRVKVRLVSFISISKVETPAFQAGGFHPGCLRGIGISDVGHNSGVVSV
jgi:hypothetical protein